ncbi:MAG: DnaJ domain-containing protein [Chloroflexota bacterium]
MNSGSRGQLRTAYAVLQVDPGADRTEIRAAYYALARRYHPDGVEPDPIRMADINRAHDAIKTAEARARYEAYGRPPIGGAEISWSGARRPQPACPMAAASPVLDFGRYEGRSVAEVARVNPDYLRWLSRHSSGLRYRDAIVQVLGATDVGRRGEAIGT